LKGSWDTQRLYSEITLRWSEALLCFPSLSFRQEFLGKEFSKLMGFFPRIPLWSLLSACPVVLCLFLPHVYNHQTRNLFPPKGYQEANLLSYQLSLHSTMTLCTTFYSFIVSFWLFTTMTVSYIISLCFFLYHVLSNLNIHHHNFLSKSQVWSENLCMSIKLLTINSRWVLTCLCSLSHYCSL
jgi:hypothetical protein